MSESDDDWSPSCWDCEREMPRRHLNMFPVHIHNEDGIGYERVDVPMCDGCRKDRMHTHECETCGQEWINLTDAMTCCPDHARRPMPDGGTEPKRRVMVDIETLGLEPGHVIWSIGAVEFDLVGLGDEFSAIIDIESCQDAGLEIDANTLKWWLRQSSTQDIWDDGLPLSDALSRFNHFYDEADEIWANSPSFDCEFLEAAYNAVGMEEPWGFRDERDVRTLLALPGAIELEQQGKEHDALDDAIYQARTVQRNLARLEELDEP